MQNVIEQIADVDVTLDDEQYFEKVFECLDEHSAYYTKEEFVAQSISNVGSMISVSFSRSEMIVKINRFGNGVDEIFSEHIEKCKKEGTKELILDLTECPGGYISVMNRIAEQILPKGKICSAMFKNGEETYYSELEECPFDRITVKISAQTASAAEILAAALQEAGVAVIIGVNSYGKTSIQSMHYLESGAAFKITCGKYLTRNGKDLTGVGVKPDVVDYSYPITVKWNAVCEKSLIDKQ